MTPMLLTEAAAIDAVSQWVARVRVGFEVGYSRAWLEQTLKDHLREGLITVVNVVTAAEQGDEIADVCLRHVGAELMERREGRLGEAQIIAYAQRRLVQPLHVRKRGRSSYDDWVRDLWICFLIDLTCRHFGVRATRSRHSRRGERHPSGCSIVTEALRRNGRYLEEATIQRHLWLGLPGELARRELARQALAGGALPPPV
jgi:hypothetical protein